MANFFDDPPQAAPTGGPDAAPALLQDGTYKWPDGTIADFPPPAQAAPAQAQSGAAKPNFFDDDPNSAPKDQGFQWSSMSIPGIAQNVAGMVKRAASIPADLASGAIDMNNPQAAVSNAGRMTDAATMSGAVSPSAVGTKFMGPSAANLLKTGGSQLDAWDKSPMMFGTDPVSKLASAMKDSLTNGKTFTDAVAPETHNALNQLINTPPNAVGVPAASLNSARQLLRDIGQGDSRDASAARYVYPQLAQFMGSAGPESVVAGASSLPAAQQGLADGLANYAAGKRVNTLNGIEDNTALGAGSANSGANIGNSERQRLKSLFQNPPSDPGAPSRAVTQGFSPDEIAQAKDIIAPTGWSVPNAARSLGNALGGGGGLGKTIGMGTGGGVGMLLAHHLGLSPEMGAAAGAAVAHGVGGYAKGLENSAVMSQAKQLADAVSQRSPLFKSGQGQQQAIFPTVQSGMTRALLAPNDPQGSQ